MVQKIKEFVQKYWDILSYVMFGVLTTVINYMVYLPCYNWLGLGAALSNAIAWVGSVAFAFYTNKRFVFKSRDWNRSVVVPELIKFVGCRFGSGLLETCMLLVAVDWLNWNGNVWKLIASIVVIVLNYAASKLLIFKK